MLYANNGKAAQPRDPTRQRQGEVVLNKIRNPDKNEKRTAPGQWATSVSFWRTAFLNGKECGNKAFKSGSGIKKYCVAHSYEMLFRRSADLLVARESR